MDSGFDEGDFKKARGMLVSFSSLLIMLWFFGADLKSVSIFGTAVSFTQNTQHVWLVTLVINSYFLLRFYQQSPGVTYSGNVVYEGSLSRFLLAVVRLLKGKAMKEEFIKRVSVLGADKDADYSYEVVKEGVRTVTSSAKKKTLIKGLDYQAQFHIRGEYISLNLAERKLTPIFLWECSCPYWLVVIAHYRAKIIANIKTSLGTEYTLPYLWGGFAAVICVVRWIATQRALLGA